jgi:diaminopimelate epimerase
MNELNFTKMVASGNDFIVLDGRSPGYLAMGHSLPELARKLCERRLSVGADGMLLIEESREADLKMRIFNPDGSEVDMCGNGSRCVALYAVENGISGKGGETRKGMVSIETAAGMLDAEVVGLRVKVRLTDPRR